ncbi:MAG: hypothetical protein RMM98_17890 [Acidobacteriota bacterium]|nr:hypothetical protein [Blastocatellia bacterium]MDW8241476.1 hypothetical protein [Acidobacteriota bacterium]
MIPQSLRPYFWDIDIERFDPRAYPDYTIARILEYGDEEAVAWLCQTFSEEEIKKTLRTERRLSRRSASFWALVYQVPFAEVAALQ